MGAWSFIEPRLRDLLPDTCVLTYQGREESASPAAGSFGLHEVEEKVLVAKALGAEARRGPAEPVVKSDGAALKPTARG